MFLELIFLIPLKVSPSGLNQLLQALLDKSRPPILRRGKTLLIGSEAYLRKDNLRQITLRRDIEDNLVVYPFMRPCECLEVVLDNEPDNLFFWNKLDNSQLAFMVVLEAISPFVLETIGIPLDTVAPPGPRIIYGLIDL